MKIYVAGKISYYPEFKDHFGREVKKLQDAGHTVLDPSTLPAGLTQQEYMSICCSMVFVADALYMLNGWEDSQGACVEHNLALKSGKQVFYEGALEFYKGELPEY